MSKKKQIIFSSLLGIVLLVVIFMPKKETTEPLDEIEVTDSLEVKEITYKYGIPIDDYDCLLYTSQSANQVVSVYTASRKSACTTAGCIFSRQHTKEKYIPIIRPVFTILEFSL